MTGSEPDSILIVDDDRTGSVALARRFERQGFRVTVVHSGRESLELLRSLHCDLVLLDLAMPELDGFQVLKAIRTTFPASDLPVLMITATDDRIHVLEALQLGANDYIVKPLDFQIVLARVRTQLSLNKTAHLRGMFHALFEECVRHFFPEAHLEPLSSGDVVQWQDSPPQATYRMGETNDGRGIGIDWLRKRYRLITSPACSIPAAEKHLIEAVVRVCDTRYRAMFDLEMPNRLQLVQHAVEDWVVAEYVRPQEPLHVLDVLKMLRTAALLTYENRRVSTGVLLRGSRDGPPSTGPSACADMPVLDSRCLQAKRFQKLCDGLHTVFLADRDGRLQGLVDIHSWVARAGITRSFDEPCPRTYTSHAAATLVNDDLCLILTPSQEIEVFAAGSLAFSYRDARWHLLDLPTKSDIWCAAAGCADSTDFAPQLLQAALNLAETRQGALLVVLDDPEQALPRLVAPKDLLVRSTRGADGEDAAGDYSLGCILGGATVGTLGLRLIEALARLDGAIVFDLQGTILSAGAILRVTTMRGNEDLPLEGARSTAAVEASYFGPVLKVSEDGAITMFLHGRRVWGL